MPPRRKKSAKNLSPEEKALLAEQKMIREEQAKRQKEELLSQFLKVRSNSKHSLNASTCSTN